MKNTWITSAFGLMFCAGAMLATGLMMLIVPGVEAWKSLIIIACAPMIVAASSGYYQIGLQREQLKK